MRAIVLAALCLLAGCATMNGLGQDMQSAGADLSDKAQEHQRPPPPPPPQQVMGYPGDDAPVGRGP